MNENRPTVPTGNWLNPATERLLSKYTNLDETLQVFKAQHLAEEQKTIANICETYLAMARNYIDRPFWSWKFPCLGRKHPHLVWELLHRVDEYFILLTKDKELHSRAIDVKTSFDLNINEEKIRKEWIGEEGKEGKFKNILEEIKSGKDLDENRALLKDALKLVNEQMDRTFWQLSMNTLTSVLSGTFLGILVLVLWVWKIRPEKEFYTLTNGVVEFNYAVLVILGLMGGYLSNLLTKQNFLYVRGGPFWRYFLRNLFSKPMMSAFAAIFIYALEKSKLIFSVNIQPGAENAAETAVSQIINLNAGADGVGYVYMVLAIVSGFAADKLLRDMFDSVLRKLEQKAEKTKDSKKE